MNSRIDFRNSSYATVIDRRVIFLLDMDCFEVQVHEKPWMRGQPRVVVNSSERILAVSYEAKQLGISRDSTPYFAQAKWKCSNLIRIDVPTRPNSVRPDTGVAKEASARIIAAIKSFLNNFNSNLYTFQYNSGDEFFIDVTGVVDSHERNGCLINQIENEYLWGETYIYNGTVCSPVTSEFPPRRLATLRRKRHFNDDDYHELRLIYGSTIACVIVNNILRETGYQSSVGIGCNKLVAKLGSNLHKPGSITVLAPSGYSLFTTYINISSIPGLGGKLGSTIKEGFNINAMSELRFIGRNDLANCRMCNGEPIGYEKAEYVLNSAHGLCFDPVVKADYPGTVGSFRQLHGGTFSYSEILDIISQHVEEILDKLHFEKVVNSRTPWKIRMNIKIKNNYNFNSNIQSDGIFSTPRELENMLLADCGPCFNSYTWHEDNEVDTLTIVAYF